MSHVVDTPVATSPDDGRSRGLALLLALMGLIGMFFTLLGWTGYVRSQGSTWGVSPMEKFW